MDTGPDNGDLIIDWCPPLRSSVDALEVLEVPTPNYILAEPSVQSPPEHSIVDTQVSYEYKGRRYTQAELDSFGNITWAIVLFFFGVAEIGALLYRIDRKAIAHCHPPICLFGYGNIPCMLASLLKIITAGIGGASNDPRFLWSIEV